MQNNYFLNGLKLNYKISIVILGLFMLTMLVLADSKKHVLRIPVFENNQACINEYLNRPLFKSKERNFIPLEFEVNTPSSSLIGFIEVSHNRASEQKDLLKGLELECYMVNVLKGGLQSLDWVKFAQELEQIYIFNKYDNLNKTKPIYIELDSNKKRYKIYQEGYSTSTKW